MPSTSDGRRLMLQGLAQLRVTLLNLLEQTHILDGDDRLIREGFEELDLLLGERPNLGATNPYAPR